MNAKYLMAADRDSYQRSSTSRPRLEQTSLQLQDSSQRSQGGLKGAQSWRSTLAMKMCRDTSKAIWDSYHILSSVARNYKTRSRPAYQALLMECRCLVDF